MSEVEKLKSFVAARLNEAASEIMAAFARTLLDYEKEVARLKEENMRHSSLVEIILKKKLPEKTASCVSESAIVEVSANPGSNPTAKTSDAGRSALDSEMYQKVKKITCKPKTGKITAFISKEQFLKFSAGKNCLFCFKEVAATEHHLLKRHYNIAVHFIRDGIARFVIPCLCSAKIQERSHWHCPCCQEIITRRCHFGMHIWKKHGYPVLRPNPETGNHRPSSNEANSSGHEGLHREEFNSQKLQQRRASLLLQKKERAEKGKITAFISKEQFLKFSTGKNCLFCFKEVAATEHHLLKRHYNLALHFLRDGIERFVIPCMCSEKIQKRSHWHCPCCHDILTRRCPFQDHIWKKHGYSVLKPNRVTGKNRPSSNEANPSVLEDFLWKEFSSQKERREGAEKDKVLNVVDVRHIGSSQPEHHNLYQSQAQEEDIHICLEDSSIDKNAGTPQLMETHQNGGVGKGLDSAGKGQLSNVTGCVTEGKDFSNTGESKKSKGASSSSDDRSPPSKKHAKSAGLN